MRPVELAAGASLTLAVHGALVVFAVLGPGWGAAHAEGSASPPGEPTGTVRYGLCGKRRCSLPEAKRRRREPEEPRLAEMDVLEAELLPALGHVDKDPRKLPELQTYEQPEVIEDGVNLDRDNEPPPERPKKDFDPRDAKRDPRNKAKSLDDVLSDFEDDDPRRNPTDLKRVIGDPDGEVGGQGDVMRAGNRYGAKVARRLREVFVVPPFLDEGTLGKLKVRVLVTRLDGDGSILAYEVQRRSGQRSFDDASIATIREFVPSEGGSRKLPRPSPDVLRYINSKGLKVTLDGGYLTR